MWNSDRILALDVGASKVVLAEFSLAKPRGLELLQYGVAELGIEPDGDADTSAYIVTTIRDLLRQHNMRPAPLLMTLSGQAVFPRYVKLPPVTKDKIQQIVQYEAEQNVPFPINEVVWDYQLISGDTAGEMSVMLVAVKTENVTRLTDCVQAAGMEPEVVDASPLALYNSVRFNYPELQGCTMVLDIGSRSSNLIFIEESRIFIRSIPVAGNAITQELMKEFELAYKDAEELKRAEAFVSFGGVYAGPENEVADRVSKVVRNVVTRLHSEVNRSINFYRSQQGGNAPSRVLLCGGASVIPHTDTFFRERLKVEVEYLNPFQAIPVNPALDVERLQSEAHLLGEVTGLALRRALTCPVEINLMPPDLVKRKEFRRRQPFFAMSIIGLVLIMLCWWVYAFKMQEVTTSQLEKVDRKIGGLHDVQATLKVRVAERRVAEARNDVLLDVVERRSRWVEIVETVHDCMPEGMWLISMQPVMGGEQIVESVEISGAIFDDKFKEIATAEANPFEVFRDRIKESTVFSDKTEIKRQLRLGDYAQEFNIWVGLRKPIEIKPNPSVTNPAGQEGTDPHAF